MQKIVNLLSSSFWLIHSQIYLQKKIMKKNLLFIAIIIASLNTVNAQQKVKYGLQTGYLLGSSLFTDEDGLSYGTTTSKSGFRIGVNASIPIGTSLVFNPEINYVNKGSKNAIDVPGFGVSIENSFTANYIEVPLNILYNIPSKNEGFYIGAGPTISMGLNGKGTLSGNSMGMPINSTYLVKFDGKTEDELPITDEDVHLRKFELGANILAGYKLKNGLNFRLNYNFGISDMDPNADGGNKNRYVALTVGFSF